MIKKSFFISIFPKIFNELLGVGIAKKALDNGIIDYEVVNPMNFLGHKERMDDTTYGGGPGMLLKAQPLIESIDFCKSKANKKTKVIYLSPQGQVFNQSISRELAKEDKLIFLLSCPIFMMLQPLSIMRKWNSASLKKAVRTFFQSNCNFSGNTEPIIVVSLQSPNQ